MRTILFLFLMTISSLQAAQYRAVLEPVSRTVLASEVSSTVTSINRRMGESFNKDDVLLTLDNKVFIAALKKAKAIALKAQANFEAKRELYKDRAITHSEFREAEAEIAMGEADLVLALKGFDACTVKAPYDGKVIQLYVKEFERVEPGQNLIEILDDSVLIAKLLLPEELWSQIQVGSEIQLAIQETGTQRMAKIVRKGAVINPVSSLFKVEAEIQNQDQLLNVGMEGLFIIPDQKNGRQ